jgi:hypothetical protein
LTSKNRQPLSLDEEKEVEEEGSRGGRKKKEK